jgi:hypothetical protein
MFNFIATLIFNHSIVIHNAWKAGPETRFQKAESIWTILTKSKRFVISPPLSPITYHLSPITYHLSPITYHLSPITYHLSPITCHLSPVTCHLSPVTCHLSPVTCLSDTPRHRLVMRTTHLPPQPMRDWSSTSEVGRALCGLFAEELLPSTPPRKFLKNSGLLHGSQHFQQFA